MIISMIRTHVCSPHILYETRSQVRSHLSNGGLWILGVDYIHFTIGIMAKSIIFDDLFSGSSPDWRATHNSKVEWASATCRGASIGERQLRNENFVSWKILTT